MNLLARIDHYGATHHPKWLDILRIGLGIILFAKGILFMQSNEELMTMVQETRIGWGAAVIAHYIILALIMGGILITLGLITRVAILFQLPILIGAVFFKHLGQGIFSLESEFWLSLITLLLLIFFLIYGSGPLSLDQALENERISRNEKEYP